MSNTPYRATIVIPAAQQAAATAAWAAIDPVGAADTFSVGLSPSGAPLVFVTHLWCSTVLAEHQLADLAAFRIAVPAAQVWVFVDHPSGAQSAIDAHFPSMPPQRRAKTDPTDILTDRGLKRIDTDI